MSRDYFNLSELAAAAAACDCSAHLHHDDQGNTIYSIGSEEIGAAEFNTFNEAMAWATNRAAGDCAEMSGGAIASALLDDLMNAHHQCRMTVLIQAAIVKLSAMRHHDRAAAGFAVGIVNVLEVGLKNLPKVAE
jgi:hypothetical protein